MKIQIIKKGTSVPVGRAVRKVQPEVLSPKLPIRGVDTDAIRKQWLSELEETKRTEQKLAEKIFNVADDYHEDEFVGEKGSVYEEIKEEFRKLKCPLLTQDEKEQLAVDTFSDDGFE